VARFLVGWELGGERGHVALLAPVVAALRSLGHDVAVAVKDLSALGGSGSSLAEGTILQAPAWPPPGPEPAGPTSQTVGDDFTCIGLDREVELGLRARAWADLIALTGADVVLAETAPTLLLAARGRCRAIAFGTAYSLPPAGRALPPALDVQRPPAATSLAHEESLRRAFDRVDRGLGGQGLRQFSDLFAVPTWVCNLKELDPYADLRATPAPGPLQLPRLADDALAAGHPGSLGDRVFVYVKPVPALPALMDALASRCRTLELFIPNAPAEVHNPWPHVTLHRTPLDLARRLPEFTAVVHFGGLNLTGEALFAGVPQLILPSHLEQSATALAVHRLGVGHCRVQVPREPEREAERVAIVGELVAAFFGDPSLAARAASFGAALRARQQPSLDGLVALCEATALG
jgi:rhamnosyltransferase subunit B